VPDEAARDAGGLGDVADAGAIGAAFGEQPKGGVADPGPGGEVLEPRVADRLHHRRASCSSLYDLAADYTHV
jgi:hypothetical protein